MKALSYLTLFILPVFFACNETQMTDDYIPTSIVDFEVDIDRPQFIGLENIGGHVLLPNEGDRGIILFRESLTNISAIESSCSYTSSVTCTEVELDGSGLFLIDPCCSSLFNFQGIPTAGPATGRLFLYNTELDGSRLRVFN